MVFPKKYIYIGCRYERVNRFRKEPLPIKECIDYHDSIFIEASNLALFYNYDSDKKLRRLPIGMFRPHYGPGAYEKIIGKTVYLHLENNKWSPEHLKESYVASVHVPMDVNVVFEGFEDFLNTEIIHKMSPSPPVRRNPNNAEKYDYYVIQ